jgi:uncharacterized protein YcfL
MEGIDEVRPLASFLCPACASYPNRHTRKQQTSVMVEANGAALTIGG